MKRFFLLFGFLITVVCHLQAAGFQTKQGKFFARAQAGVHHAQLYLSIQAEQYTIKGFESYMGRKLTIWERKAFKQLNKPDLSPEEEAGMMRNKRLATWSMIMGIAGLVFLFVPYFSLISFLLLPAALITGIIALNRSNNFKNERESGSGRAIAGIATGGAGLLIFILAIGVLIALL